MRASAPCALVALIAWCGCTAPRAEQQPVQIEAQATFTPTTSQQTRHSELVSMLGTQPAQTLQVGADLALVVWSFERRFSELESPVVHIVALEDRKGRVEWWYQVPAPLAYVCGSASCPLCTPTRVLWPLVDGAESPEQREQILLSSGFLER